jgi:hypothetical protein
VTAVREWYVDESVPQVAARSATFICGVGRKTAG